MSGSSNSAGLADFDVEVSTDGQTFTLVHSGTLPQNNVLNEVLLPAPVDASHVRIVAQSNYGGTSVRIREVEVNPVPSTNTSFSSYSGINRRPDYMFDGDGNTSWSGQGVTEWVKFRLAHGEEQLIDTVVLTNSFVTQAVKDFEIWASNGTHADADFFLVISGTAAMSNDPQEFTFPPLRARYVKLVTLSNYGASSVNLKKFEVRTVETIGNILTVATTAEDVARNESPAQTGNGAVVVDFSSEGFNGSPRTCSSTCRTLAGGRRRPRASSQRSP